MKTELKGIDGKVAIHCQTETEAIQVCKIFHEAGLKWMDGTSYLEVNGWSDWGRIYYNPSEGTATPGNFVDNLPVLSAADFIAMNTEPEAAPAWSFKTDEELKNFVATFLATKGDFEQFLSSLRNPAFELICQDGVVTDPEQIVYWNASGLGKSKARDVKEWGYRCWISEAAALNHRRHNTPAIKLSDMTLVNDTYFISKDVAENLVNERIK